MSTTTHHNYVILAREHWSAPLGFVAKSTMFHEDTVPFQVPTDGSLLGDEWPELQDFLDDGKLPVISHYAAAKMHNSSYKLEATKLYKGNKAKPASPKPVDISTLIDNTDSKKTMEEVSKKYKQAADEEKAAKKVTPKYVPKTVVEEDVSEVEQTKEETIKEALAELDQMVGLDDVKQHIRRLVNFQMVNERRKEIGLPVAQVSHHLAFEGPPGTGKTTVARIIAKLYKALGIIYHDTVVETDRGGLVGSHIGETALKTSAQIDRAKGGVLFIDEAYALARGGDKDYGREAMSTLIKAMEDHRDQLVVIFAGYSKEMENLWNMNSGLKSRVPARNRIKFPSYSPKALLEIANLIATESGYSISSQAQTAILNMAESHPKGSQFGNGRWSRDIVETAVMEQANRIINTEIEIEERLDDDQLDVLTLEDFSTAE